MPSVGSSEHKRFCEIDDWQELKSARGKKRDHDYFTKTLANGDILRTKVSRNKKTYGESFWRRICREQLGLEDEEQFWEALRSGKSVPRRRQVEPPKRPTIPTWLVDRLIHTVGVQREEIARMSVEEADQCWQRFQSGEEFLPAEE